MKVTIEKIPEVVEEEILVKCHDTESQWVTSVKALQNEGENIIGKWEDDFFSISLKNIYYFECVDNRSFFYTKDKVFESKLKVYEFEEKTKNAMFFKASKSTVVNIRKIRSVKPFVSGKFELTLLNENKLLVSRLYVNELKKIMGL